MCRGSAWCSRLPEDPSEWDPWCPLPPPGWFPVAAAEFREALGLAIVGNSEAALEHLELCRGDELRDWFVEHAQNTAHFRAPRNTRTTRLGADTDTPPGVGSTQVKTRQVRYPLDLEAQVFARDGWRCRYCATPVIVKPALLLAQSLFGDVFPLGRTNGTRHGVRLALSANLDHVEPWSAGGTSLDENLVTACWCCNFGKSNATLDQLRLNDPRTRPPVRSNWDGCTGLLTKRRRAGGAARTRP